MGICGYVGFGIFGFGPFEVNGFGMGPTLHGISSVFEGCLRKPFEESANLTV